MKTVKVRIAVQVDPEGNWDAGGDSDVDSTVWADHNGNWEREGAKRYWVTAELPVPVPAEIETVAGTAVEETAEAVEAA